MCVGGAIVLDALMDMGRPILTVRSTFWSREKGTDADKAFLLFFRCSFGLHPASAPADFVSAIRSSFLGFPCHDPVTDIRTSFFQLPSWTEDHQLCWNLPDFLSQIGIGEAYDLGLNNRGFRVSLIGNNHC